VLILTNAYARTISKSYNFYTSNPVAHLSGQKKQVELPFQPTIKELPDSVKMKAEMVKIIHVVGTSRNKRTRWFNQSK
jgi:hypothetical protein